MNPLFFLAALVGMARVAKSREPVRQITFRVTTAEPLAVGEQVFITGNDEAIGSWRPDGFPLTRMADRLWSGAAMVAADTALEFKVTRGSWDDEEVLEDGRVPPNRSTPPGPDAVLPIEVRKWKDAHVPHDPQITGNYRVHDAFRSAHLRYDRRIIVWLPPSYEEQPERRYPVLYMQDGQQVFDPRTSTWNYDWQVDESCTRLIAEERLPEIIVCAVYSTEDRIVEYNPSMAGPAYVNFMVEELKPFLDAHYHTLPGRETTAVAGSSFGATISFYLAWSHPDVFFGAACLSPAFHFENDRFVLDLVRDAPRAPDLKLYLYCGLGDATEQQLASGLYEMAELLKDKGLVRGRNLLVRENPAGRHDEASWSQQNTDWLPFLFPK